MTTHMINNRIEYKYMGSKLNILYKLFTTICAICFSQLLISSSAIADSTIKDQYVNKDGAWLDFNWLAQTVQFHGFLSQGFVHTSDNNFFGDSANRVSTDYREAGINGSWRVVPELQLSMQLVYRDAGLTDDQGVRVDYALADYSFYSTENKLLGIKAGRIPTPLGFYNETRDVLSTRPTILLPQSIYFDRNRNIALSADGGYLYGEQRSNFGDVFFDIGVVTPRTNDPDAKYSLAGDLAGDFDGKTSWVGRLAYEWQSGKVRLQATYADFHTKYDPDSTMYGLLPGTIKFNPLVFSAQYNGENWSLTSEYEFNRKKFDDFGLIPDSDSTGNGFYIQGTYNFASWLEGVLRYDDLVIDQNDKNGKEFADLTGLPAHSRYAKDWTVGLRFTVIPKLIISAEYHHVKGTAWLANIENKDPAETKERWDMFLMMISFDF